MQKRKRISMRGRAGQVPAGPQRAEYDAEARAPETGPGFGRGAFASRRPAREAPDATSADPRRSPEERDALSLGSTPACSLETRTNTTIGFVSVTCFNKTTNTKRTKQDLVASFGAGQ